MSARATATALAIILYLLSTWLPAGQTPGTGQTPAAGQRPGAEGGSPGAVVVGYYVYDSRNPSYASMVRAGAVLTSISPWAWAVQPDGAVRAAADTDQLTRVLEAAGSRGLSVLPLVHNNPNGAFDADVVHRLLTSPEASRQAVENLARLAREYRVEGLALDFENVPASDRASLTRFVAALADALHRDGRRLAVAVPARTTESASRWASAYDYAALGRAADQLWLMTYDQHHRTGPPGPVASLPWVEQAVRYAVSQVPSSRVVLGLPAYGYEWSRSGGPARALTYEEAVAGLRASGATLRWHPVHKVPYYSHSGREVWFEDRYSAGYKLTLVKRYRLAGVAIWRLGQEDPGLWEVIARSL